MIQPPPAQVSDYLDLITTEHADKPNFKAVLTASLQPLVDAINTLASLPDLFDLDQAIGEQLDFVGQWVGIARDLPVPIPNVFFSFNTVNLGFNQGVWFDPSNPAEGLVTMDDATYRLMIKAKIAANVWDGSLEDANKRLATLFTDGSVEVKDNMNMTYSLIIGGTVPSALFQELVQAGFIPLRPAGVALV